MSSLFSGEITISSIFLEFYSGTDFGLTILSAILFPMLQLPYGILFFALKTASSPIFVVVSNNCFPYLVDRFLANDKNPYPLTYILF